MKSRVKHSHIHLFCLLGGVAVILLSACNKPPLIGHCNEIPNNPNLQGPIISKITVNGCTKNIDNLEIAAREEDLMIDIQPVEVDSYFFKLQVDGLNPCGIATRYPQIRFTFLPGGKHELEYWAQKDGKSSAHKILHFSVYESMIETGWFYPSLVAYILLIAGAIVYFWALYNIRQKLKMQQIRSRIAADLHDEVSSDLSSIAISMATLERRGTNSEEFTGTMLEIKQTLTDTQHNLSDTVWAIKPEKDTGRELFQRMEKFAQQMLASGDTSLVFQNTILPNKPLKINMEQRHNIYKIYKEAIHNIYKHACATEVNVLIYPHPDGIGIEIRDNGIGFDLAAEREGSGINNYHWRAKENFIEFYLESVPGKGTTIKMTIPQF